MLDADAARGQDLRHERAQLGAAAMDPGLARRLAEIAVGFEGRDDRVDVAGGERALVVGDRAGDVRGRIAPQQRRADAVMAFERPEAVIDAQRAHAAGRRVVADDGDREIDVAPLVPQAQHGLDDGATAGMGDRAGRDPAARAASQACRSPTNRSSASGPRTAPANGLSMDGWSEKPAAIAARSPASSRAR